jgi:putative transposase
MLLVYRYRIKSLTGFLNSQARACNFVWNFCNDTQLQALKWNKPMPLRSGRGSGAARGLKDFAALSTGEKIENPRYLRQLADRLAIAQRARKRRQATNLYARITQARRDFHHKLSTRIVREFDYIAVGNVNAAGLAKTRLAKSVLDAGWSSFRGMLRYKALAHGAWYEEVNESFSSRDCSSCQAKTGPKGIAELGIRSWICSECGVSHDRDINSARIILFRSGHRTPAEGIPALF